MRLLAITPHVFRAFGRDVTVELDPHVTVLTGSNDCGKTALLDLLSLSVGMQQVQQSDVNEDYALIPANHWDTNSPVGATLRFGFTNDIDPTTYLQESERHRYQNGDEFTLRTRLAPSFKDRPQSVTFESAKRGSLSLELPRQRPRRLCHVLWLPPSERGVSEVIDVTKPNATERTLLKLAFGNSNPVQEIANTTPRFFSKLLESAEERINQHLRRMLPAFNPLTVRFRPIKGHEREQISVELCDRWGAATPFGWRGAGIRKMLSALTLLAEKTKEGEDTLVLIDEPENSLHADSQHLLRSTLEEVSRAQRVQVVYATHSPAMLNPVRPTAVRLLRRTSSGEVATTLVDEHPVKNSYEGVRSALGISAADSLVYAPISIVFEGVSDIYAIGILLERFYREGHEAFAEVPGLLASCSLIDGRGDELIQVCKIAKSHGTKPIIFVDGDKNRQLRARRVAETFADVPIVELDAGNELENLVDLEEYILALRQLLDLDENVANGTSFRAWDSLAGLPAQMMLSKRIDRWLASFDPALKYDKPEVILRCVRQVPLAKVLSPKLLELLDAIRARSREPWTAT